MCVATGMIVRCRNDCKAKRRHCTGKRLSCAIGRDNVLASKCEYPLSIIPPFETCPNLSRFQHFKRKGLAKTLKDCLAAGLLSSTYNFKLTTLKDVVDIAFSSLEDTCNVNVNKLLLTMVGH